MLDPDCTNRRKADQRPWQLQTDGSGLVEQVLEYQFLALLTPELLRRGLHFEVLRGDFDRDGHDLVIEAGGVMRHIQLKCMVAGGKTRHVPVNTRLQSKPSGCVIWMTYDPDTLAIDRLRWFGGAPGSRLPDLGSRVARHTRANRDGVKGERRHIRILPAGRFTEVENIVVLADRLFGRPELAEVRHHLAGRDEPVSGWLATVRAGDFAAVPDELEWDTSLELAMLIDGYELAEQLGLGDPLDFEARQLEASVETGSWPGSAAELWVTLFLEHRRWRFSSPHQPDPEMHRLLDRLAGQLRDALVKGLYQ